MPGSSPRMRGAHPDPVRCRAALGIIPAYAGSTATRSTSCPTAWDHPRVCGEHTSTLSAWTIVLGSSPRMRGARTPQRDARRRPRIIPAYAGSTSRPARRRTAPRDHPRVCGEHSGQSDALSRSKGSSPRMRGARRAHERRSPKGRIIPAYAGSTDRRGRWRRRGRDHPRVCGEHTSYQARSRLRRGSSPRMRGART